MKNKKQLKLLKSLSIGAFPFVLIKTYAFKKIIYISLINKYVYNHNIQNNENLLIVFLTNPYLSLKYHFKECEY